VGVGKPGEQADDVLVVDGSGSLRELACVGAVHSAADRLPRPWQVLESARKRKCDDPSVTTRAWTNDAFRSELRGLTDRIADDDVETAAMDLWRSAFAHVDLWVFAEGLWNIWGRITDEFTHPRGDPAEGTRLAREAAANLGDVLGDESAERQHCDVWIYERLDIT
jgi:hypothetical protein